MMPANTPFSIKINQIQNSISLKPTAALTFTINTAPPTYPILTSSTLTITNTLPQKIATAQLTPQNGGVLNEADVF